MICTQSWENVYTKVYTEVFHAAREAASTNEVLLDPKRLLTKVLSSSAINMVSNEASKVYQKRVLHTLN